MLNINIDVERGIPFLNLDGILNTKTFNMLGKEINSLLYNYGFRYFVLDFREVDNLEEATYINLQSKLVEIFLNCGQVVLCGLRKKDKIGYTKDKLYYVNNRQDAFKYLYL